MRSEKEEKKIKFKKEKEKKNYNIISAMPHSKIWDAMLNLIPFVQFKKREKHPWRSVKRLQLY